MTAKELYKKTTLKEFILYVKNMPMTAHQSKTIDALKMYFRTSMSTIERKMLVDTICQRLIIGCEECGAYNWNRTKVQPVINLVIQTYLDSKNAKKQRKVSNSPVGKIVKGTDGRKRAMNTVDDYTNKRSAKDWETWENGEKDRHQIATDRGGSWSPVSATYGGEYCYWEKGTANPQVGYKPVKDKKEADVKVSATADKELKLSKTVTPAERRFRDWLISAKTIPMSPVYFELISHGLSTDHIESIVDRMSINRKYGYDIVGNDLKLKKTTEIFIKEEFKDGVFKFYFAVKIYNDDDKKYVTRKFEITDLV